MPLAAITAMEIQAFAQVMYPDKPSDQAVFQFYRDLYEFLPESVGPNLPELGLLLASVSGLDPKLAALGKIAMIIGGLAGKPGTKKKGLGLTPLVDQKDMSVINGSFNSNPRFASAFSCAALALSALAIKVGMDAVRRIGSALDAIKDELSIQNVANVQGWGEGGLGYHIHRLVSMEIEKSNRENGLHLFYVWTPGNTSWHARFAERCRDSPLGRQFGGYHHDLGAICNLMWSNRRTLVEMLPPGRDAIFYLLVPSFETIAIDDPIIFHESLQPLVVKGDLYRGHPLVWLNAALHPRPVFQDVGILPDINIEIHKTGGKAFLGCWLSGAACAVTMAVGGALCPPLLPLGPYMAAGFGSSCLAGMATAIGTTGTMIYNDLNKPEPQVLGPPNFANLST